MRDSERTFVYSASACISVQSEAHNFIFSFRIRAVVYSRVDVRLKIESFYRVTGNGYYVHSRVVGSYVVLHLYHPNNVTRRYRTYVLREIAVHIASCGIYERRDVDCGPKVCIYAFFRIRLCDFGIVAIEVESGCVTRNCVSVLIYFGCIVAIELIVVVCINHRIRSVGTVGHAYSYI